MTDNDDESAAPAGQQRAAERRDQAGRRRDVAADRRDHVGHRRDDKADFRDQVADVREHRDDPTQQGSPVSAAQDRTHARADRVSGASDRVHAAHDRHDASADRQAAARDRRQAAVDGLTGVYTRKAGLVELERDLARVRRTGHALVLAFVDVDHLKTINDRLGHAAGDRLLQQVADALTAALRPYDLVIRHGGDEFLCAIQGIDAAIARPRLARVNTLLAEAGERGSISVGLAELQPHESSQDLIARADADLYRRRRHRTQ